MKAMARQRSHSIEFKRQVAQEFIAGESLYALSKRHDISRQLIRVWVQKYEAGASLLRGSPPLSGASVLSASQLEPLVPFPLASPARFSRSIQEPGRASRCLHAGCRSVGIRTSTELIPEDGSAPGFDIT